MKDLTTDGLLQRFLPVMMAGTDLTLDQPVNVKTQLWDWRLVVAQLATHRVYFGVFGMG
jgi:hypothetical protein